MRAAEDPDTFELLSRICALTPFGCRLFPYGYAFFNRKIKEIDRRTQMNIGFSGHSARAGFASERVARGESRGDIQDRGRWKTTSSFQVYVDVTLSTQIDVAFRLQGHAEAAQFCLANLDCYFSASIIAAEGGHHAALARADLSGAAKAIPDAYSRFRGAAARAAQTGQAGYQDVAEATSNFAAARSQQRKQQWAEGQGTGTASSWPRTADSLPAASARPAAKSRIQRPFR